MQARVKLKASYFHRRSVINLKLVLLIAMLIAFTSANQAPAQADDSVEAVLETGLVPFNTQRWERQYGVRKDFDDKLPWRGCVYYADKPDYEEARRRCHISDNLAASGHLDEAIKEASAAIALQPFDNSYRLFRVHLYLHCGQNDQAKEDLRSIGAHAFPALDENLDLAQLALKVDEYQLAEDTVKAMLPTVHRGLDDYKAALQYILACSQEHLGEHSDSMKNYAQAARFFLASREFSVVKTCLSRIDAISKKSGFKPENVEDLRRFVSTATGTKELKKMVSQLVSESSCLNKSVAERITHSKLVEFKENVYIEKPSQGVTDSAWAPLTGIRGSSLNTVPGKMLSLSIMLNPRNCPLYFKDLESILKDCSTTDACAEWRLNGTNWRYKIPSGILVLCAAKGPLEPITDIDVIDGDERKLVRPPQEVVGAMHDKRRGVGYQIANGNVDEALAITTDWVKDQPKNPGAQFAHAKALMLAKQYADAIKCLDIVDAYAKTASANDRFHYRYKGNPVLVEKGVCQTKMGEYADALLTFKSAFPPRLDGDLYYDRACAENGLGQLDAACADLEKAENIFYLTGRIVRRDETRQLLTEVRKKREN